MFDFIVVTTSLLAVALASTPGLSSLRLLRAVRVLRLFARLPSLRRIVNALTASLVPVSNAFLIMLLVVSIYSENLLSLLSLYFKIIFSLSAVSIFSEITVHR